MNLILSLATLTSVAIVHGQSSDKGMIPFPRVGRPDRYYMDGKRDGNSLSPGLIPFPRIGRSEGIHEGKRQLIPFPRVGKRPFWHIPMDQYLVDYEEFAYPASDAGTTDPNMLRPGFRGLSGLTDPSGNALEENDTEKRNGNGNNGGGMWFGPRLGKRRKRSIETDTSAEHSRDSLDTRTLLKILHNFNWAIVPIKESRPQRYSHTSEEIGVHRRAPPYIPRLGRSKEVASAEVDDEVHTGRYSKNDNAEHRKSGQSTPETTINSVRE